MNQYWVQCDLLPPVVTRLSSDLRLTSRLVHQTALVSAPVPVFTPLSISSLWTEVAGQPGARSTFLFYLLSFLASDLLFKATCMVDIIFSSSFLNDMGDHSKSKHSRKKICKTLFLKVAFKFVAVENLF